jgi:hypothetical protein
MTLGTGDDVAVLILDSALAMALRTDFHAALSRSACHIASPGTKMARPIRIRALSGPLLPGQALARRLFVPVRVHILAHVRFGSKAEILTASTCCLLYRGKRTLIGSPSTSA